MGILLNNASILRLIGAVLFEQNDEWQAAGRNMPLEAFTRIDHEKADPISDITRRAA